MEELIIKEKETKEELVKLLQNSQLPAFILKPMIADIYSQLNNEYERQYNQAKQNQEQKKEKKEKKGE